MCIRFPLQIEIIQMNRIIRTIYRICAVFLLWSIYGCGQLPDQIQRPGLQSDGSILLANGRYLTPAGDRVEVDGIPLGMALSPDGKYAVTVNSGSTENSLSVIDINRREEILRFPVENAWKGICFSPEGNLLYVSGGSANIIEVFRFSEGTISQEKTLFLDRTGSGRNLLPAGLAVSPDGKFLVSANFLDNSIAVFDLEDDSDPHYVPAGNAPYAVVIHPVMPVAYVSNAGDNSVSVVDLENLSEIARVGTGGLPAGLAIKPDGSMLFVANNRTDDITFIDTKNNKIVGTVDISPFAGAPAGSQPTALTVTPDGTTLIVSNSGENSLVLIDITKSPAAVMGRIPTGAYPADVEASADNSVLVAINSIGSGISRNDTGKNEYETGVSAGISGTLSIIQYPDSDILENYTEQVSLNNGFADLPEKLKYGITFRPPRAIPRKIGEASLINYVFYIIKGNLHYEQVFDTDSDEYIELLDPDLTTNHRTLAEEYVLLDNFYVNSSGRREGFEWSTAALTTDIFAGLTRSANNQQGVMDSAWDVLTTLAPYTGYLWDAAIHNDVSFRSYGIFVSYGEGNTFPVTADRPSLQGYFAPGYPSYDPEFSDLERASIFIEEFNTFIADGTLPQFSILYLPDDHIETDDAFGRTAQERIADNDRALGMIVEAISSSPVWQESAIFVVESSSRSSLQVPARTVALAVSPYVKHGFVDHTLYDTSSIIRSIGLILGIPPLSQFDASAIPLYNSFTEEALIKPFKAR